jgi:hypothetical protein
MYAALIILILDEFAVANDLNLTEAYLPNLFFTNCLRSIKCKLEGIEGLGLTEKTSIGKLKELIRGLEDGSVRFVYNPTDPLIDRLRL